ncbi:hypothetical protein JY651_26790 [Pyxidicoccus parkwayensis]|uniref:Lipoprotein n=1 Tax=Pyxidicoccus parkwayensis TaxID=2813578 RepID=A0ABX7NJG1_9BACT|nr:hypothetical protein [Pyxidicoccus parkwaysis]QSQ18959.1 hypothetical protein JY651_26790 [Pyxidicoccus parkwaysis]
MKLNTFIIGLSLGGLLAACGGAPEEMTGSQTPADESPIGETEQGVCEGYDNGARHCTFKCTANDFRHWYAYNAVAWGQCHDVAVRDCGREPYSVCWSIP